MKKKGNDEDSTEPSGITFNISATKVISIGITILVAIWGYIKIITWSTFDDHNDIRYVTVVEASKRTTELEKRATAAEEAAREAKAIATKSVNDIAIIERDNHYRDKRLDEVEEVNKKQWQLGRKP